MISGTKLVVDAGSRLPAASPRGSAVASHREWERTEMMMVAKWGGQQENVT
jgi:hypothetical protein